MAAAGHGDAAAADRHVRGDPACAAVAGVLAVQHETTVSAPRARTYLAFDACLLTRERGLAGPQAAQAWAGLQRASLATHAKVEYLPVMGSQTAVQAMLPRLSAYLGHADPRHTPWSPDGSSHTRRSKHDDHALESL